MRDEETEMSMSPEVQREYDDALRVAILTLTVEGRYDGPTLTNVNPSVYDWRAEYDEQRHVMRAEGGGDGCSIFSDATPAEDTWSEFVDTFSGNDTHTGVSLPGVGCACGRLRDRELRWEATVTQVTEALFAQVFTRIRSLEDKL